MTLTRVNFSSNELNPITSAKEPINQRSQASKVKQVALVVIAGIGGMALGAGIAGLVFTGAIIPLTFGAVIGLGAGLVIGLMVSKIANKRFAPSTEKFVVSTISILTENEIKDNRIKIETILRLQNNKYFLMPPLDLKKTILQAKFQETNCPGLQKKANEENERNKSSVIEFDDFAFENADCSETFQTSDLNAFKASGSFPEENSAPINKTNYRCLKDNNRIDTGITMLPFKPRGGSKSQCEDGFNQLITDKFSLVTVIDGHNGHQTKTFLEEHLLRIISEKLETVIDHNDEEIYRVFYESFQECNEKLFSASKEAKTSAEFEGFLKSGAAACVVLQIGEDVWTANAGDCRAILVYGDENGLDSIQLSVDCDTKDITDKFKVAQDINARELEQVQQQGIGVALKDKARNIPIGSTFDGEKLIPQTAKTCECFRAFGDLLFPGVTCEPKITKTPIDRNQGENARIILFSDGVTKSAGSTHVVSFVKELLKEGKPNSEIARDIAYKSRNVVQYIQTSDGGRRQVHPNTDDITVAVFNAFPRDSVPVTS